MTSKSQFQSTFDGDGDFEFAPGVVRGTRWWRLSPDGRLQGALKGDWVRGENVARCRKDDYVLPPLAVRSWGVQFGPGPNQASHPAPDPECACGFYGFWDRDPIPQLLPDASSLLAVGVIEGYGRTLIGTAGFKSEKARIVGLHLPPSLSYPMAPSGYIQMPFGAAAIPVVAGNGVVTLSQGQWQRMASEQGYPLAERAFGELTSPGAARAISGLPFYSSMEEMLAQHPPTPDYLPTPAADEPEAER